MPPDRRESEISGFDDELILKNFLVLWFEKDFASTKWEHARDPPNPAS